MRVSLRFRIATLAVVVFGGFGLGANGCEGDLLSDPTFHTWCGDSLCSWKVEEGSVQRAPTWHEKDYGVALVDTPTSISQTVKDSPKCILFTTVADVDPAAQVTLGLDYDADGTIDDEQPIAATGFQPARIQVTAPVFYSGIRFVIRKKGVGRAVLAEMRAQDTTGCTAPPFVLSNLPLGDPCKFGSDCHSGVCCESSCAECCSVSAACANGASCEPRPDQAAQGVGILQCGGGRRDRPSGADCRTDDDCQSHACDGASAQAAVVEPDGGLEPCPDASYPDAGAGCTFQSVRGGRCR